MIKSLLFISLLGITYYFDLLPLSLIALYLLMSVITFIAYGIDKSAAQHQRWRIKEGTLHLLSFFCGWPGALLAQHYFRHKTQKVRFKRSLYLAIIFNLLIMSIILLLAKQPAFIR